MMRACLILVAGFLVGSSAYAADVVVVPTDRARMVVLAGKVATGDHQQFRKLIASAGADIVVLDRPYGQTDEAVLLAAEVRRAKLSTFISGRDDCSHSCALIFLAGRTKYAGEGARIGVPPAGFIAPTGKFPTGAVLKWLGVPKAMRSHLARTPDDQLYWMTEADKAQLRIVSVGPENVTAGAEKSRSRSLYSSAKHAKSRAPRPRPVELTSAVREQAADLIEPTSGPPHLTYTGGPGMVYLTVPDALPRLAVTAPSAEIEIDGWLSPSPTLPHIVARPSAQP